MVISISMRQYLSISHLSAACLFAEQCKELEQLPQPDERARRKHDACAVSSVILSAAFLEATINEVFSDCAGKHSTDMVQSLPARDLMGRLWMRGIPRTAAYSILEKYEIALELNGRSAMNEGANPYQDAKLLVELRNALIHFEPETIVSHPVQEGVKLHKFEKRLKGKFGENKLTGAGNPFYPDKLLGAGCANWAVVCSVAFADHFFASMGMKPAYVHVRSDFLHGLVS
jgi:hypothetical protein